MKISTGSNIASLKAQRQLNESTNKLSKVSERLASGLRINSAVDDAAGLAIANSLRTESKIAIQGIRNLNDGISLLNIAESSISSLTSIVSRIQELASQAANGAYSSKQREALDKEAQALSKEYTRVIQTTTFNGKNILSSNFGNLSLQAGIGTSSILSSSMGGVIGNGLFSLNFNSAISPSSWNGDIKTGDLNGDGILDYVSSNEAGFSEVFLGQASGGFSQAITYSGGGSGVALEDLNNDGILDLATTNGASPTIRLGTGNGTFGQAVSYTFNATFARDIKFGDLNGDGNLDLIATGYSAGSGIFEVRMGRGDGTFGTSISYVATGTSSAEAALGDINGDGILDIVISGGRAPNTANISYRLGIGDGTFGASSSRDVSGVWARSVTLSDVNNDGKLDIVSAGRANTFADGVANILLGSGSGTFGSVISYDTEAGSSLAVTTGDINGDGNLDLITGGYDDSNFGYFTIRLGSGSGTFGTAVSYGNSNGKFFGLTLDDYNKDGVLDVFTAGASGALGINSIFTSNTTTGTAPLLPFSLATIADAKDAMLNLDRKQDDLGIQRAQIGAFMSRVEIASSVLSSTKENLIAAESRIRDADMAQEAAEFVRLKVLQQSTIAVLTQANQQPRIVLELLADIS